MKFFFQSIILLTTLSQASFCQTNPYDNEKESIQREKLVKDKTLEMANNILNSVVSILKSTYDQFTCTSLETQKEVPYIKDELIDNIENFARVHSTFNGSTDFRISKSDENMTQVYLHYKTPNIIYNTTIKVNLATSEPPTFDNILKEIRYEKAKLITPNSMGGISSLNIYICKKKKDVTTGDRLNLGIEYSAEAYRKLKELITSLWD